MAVSYEVCLEHGKYGRRIRGSFTPSGAGVSSATGATRGTGFTPSHSGTTGIYRITLEEGFVSLLSGLATFQSENAYTTPTTVHIGTVDASAKTVDIIVWAESAGALAKSNVTASGILRRINFELIVATENIPGVGAGV